METAVAFAVILASCAVIIAALLAIFVMGYFLYAIRSAITTARRLKHSTTELGSDMRTAFLEALRIVPRIISGSREKKSRSKS